MTKEDLILMYWLDSILAISIKWLVSRPLRSQLLLRHRPGLQLLVFRLCTRRHIIFERLQHRVSWL